MARGIASIELVVAMGRALMLAPRLLILDEPSLGLSPIMCGEIAKIIKDIHGEGRTVILVEQNAHMALTISNTGFVMDTGGSPIFPAMVTLDFACQRCHETAVRRSATQIESHPTSRCPCACPRRVD